MVTQLNLNYMKKSLLKLNPSTMIYSSFSNSNPNPTISRILGKKIIFFRYGNIFDSAPKFFRYKSTGFSTLQESQFYWTSSYKYHQHLFTTMARGRNGKKTPPKTQPKRRGNRQRNKNNSSDNSPDSKKQKVLNLKEQFTITPIVVSPVVNDKISTQTSDFQLLEDATGMSDDSSKSSIPDPPSFKEIFLLSLILLLPPPLQKPIHIRSRISFKPLNLQLVHIHLLLLPLWIRRLYLPLPLLIMKSKMLKKILLHLLQISLRKHRLQLLLHLF